MFMKLAKKQEGFTLVELLIVVTIIGILAALAVPRFLVSQKESEIKTCRGNLSRLNEAIGRYKFDTGSYPTALSALVPDYLDRVPKCPTNASYSVNKDSGLAECDSKDSEHALPTGTSGSGGGSGTTG